MDFIQIVKIYLNYIMSENEEPKLLLNKENLINELNSFSFLIPISEKSFKLESFIFLILSSCIIKRKSLAFSFLLTISCFFL